MRGFVLVMAVTINKCVLMGTWGFAGGASAK